jgi:Trypsin-co-occurring domain 1
MDTFRAMTRRPEEVEITFGVTFDGKLGGVIASTNAGAQLQVMLRWHGSAVPVTADEEAGLYGYADPSGLAAYRAPQGRLAGSGSCLPSAKTLP